MMKHIEFLLEIDESQLDADNKLKLELIKYLFDKDYQVDQEKVLALVKQYLPELIKQKPFSGVIEILDKEAIDRLNEINPNTAIHLCIAIEELARSSLILDPNFGELLEHDVKKKETQMDRTDDIYKRLTRDNPWLLFTAREKAGGGTTHDNPVLGVIALDEAERKFTYLPVKKADSLNSEDTIPASTEHALVEVKFFFVDLNNRDRTIGTKLLYKALNYAFDILLSEQENEEKKVHFLCPRLENLIEFFVNKGFEKLGSCTTIVGQEAFGFMLMVITEKNWKNMRKKLLD